MLNIVAAITKDMKNYSQMQYSEQRGNITIISKCNDTCSFFSIIVTLRCVIPKWKSAFEQAQKNILYSHVKC
jgi:hypothetical protein